MPCALMRTETTLPVHSAGTLVRLRSADTRHVLETRPTSKIGGRSIQASNGMLTGCSIGCSNAKISAVVAS